MLKAKGYKKGNLYERIDQAAKDHIITDDMALWAHEVRIDANDQRHADEAASLPEEPEAKRCLDFAGALAQFMFILTAQVKQGLQQATQKQSSP